MHYFFLLHWELNPLMRGSDWQSEGGTDDPNKHLVTARGRKQCLAESSTHVRGWHALHPWGACRVPQSHIDSRKQKCSPSHVNQVGKLPIFPTPSTLFLKNCNIETNTVHSPTQKLRWFYKPESLQDPSPEEEGVNHSGTRKSCWVIQQENWISL